MLAKTTAPFQSQARARTRPDPLTACPIIFFSFCVRTHDMPSWWCKDLECKTASRQEHQE